MYGFYEETQKKYGSTSVWKIFNEVFDYLPLAAVVNRKSSLMQNKYFACTEDSLRIYIRLKKLTILIESAKYPLLEDSEIWFGQIQIK